MFHKLFKNQLGFAPLLVTLAIVFVSLGGVLVYIRYQDSQSNPPVDSQAATDAPTPATPQTASPTDEPQEKDEGNETPPSSPTPAPDRQPQPASTISHPTQAHCKPDDGQFTVYGSLEDGAPTYFDEERTKKSEVTIPYGTAVKVHCFDDSIQKLVYADFFVAPASVSTTKP